jgi:hypothetical protein
VNPDSQAISAHLAAGETTLRDVVRVIGQHMGYDEPTIKKFDVELATQPG